MKKDKEIVQTEPIKKIVKNEDLFKFTNRMDETKIESSVKFKGLYREAFSKFSRNKSAMWGLGIFLFFIVAAIFIVPFAMSPYVTNSQNTLQAPNSQHWFGTDDSGRDLWSRVWWGVLYSITLSLIATSINIFIAVAVGITSGYYNRVDSVFNWIMKIVFAVPNILILIVFSTTFGASFAIMVAGMTMTSWANASQQIRAQVMRVKNLDFVTASLTLKTNQVKLLKLFFVYSIPTIITQFSILFPRMILLEATLGFLGLSVPDAPMLGSIISNGRAYIIIAPWITFIPVGFLVGIVGSFQLVSFGLEDAFENR